MDLVSSKKRTDSPEREIAALKGENFGAFFTPRLLPLRPIRPATSED